MTITAFKPLLPMFVFFVGGSLVLLVSALGARPGMRRFAGWMSGLVIGALSVFGGIALGLDFEPVFWAPCLVLAALYFFCFVLPSRAFRTFTRAAQRHFSPRWRSRLALVACGSAAAVSLALVLTDTGAVELIDFGRAISPEKVTLEVVETAAAFTDKGRRVVLKTNKEFKLDAAMLGRQNDLLARQQLRDHVIHVVSGWQNCNCHGWVFTNGQYWVTGCEVDPILEDNGYRLVTAPLPGDVAVYRDGEEKVIHTGIVRCLDPEAHLILVESKWGGLGRFIHPHDTHCYAAESCTFYRSSRPGHRLRGIPFENDSTMEPPPHYSPAARPTPLHS